MKALIKQYKGLGPVRKSNGFHTLARAVVGQQISVKAADSVWAKFENLLNGKIEPAKVLKLKEKDLRAAGLSSQKINYMYNVANFFVDEMNGDLDLISHQHDLVAEKLIEVKGIGKWTVDMFMMFHMHAHDILPIGDLGLLNAVKKHYELEAQASLRAPAKQSSKLSSRAQTLASKSRDLDPSTPLRFVQDDKNKKLSAVSSKHSAQKNKPTARDKKELEQKIIKISEKWKPYRTVATWYLWRSLDPVEVEY